MAHCWLLLPHCLSMVFQILFFLNGCGASQSLIHLYHCWLKLSATTFDQEVRNWHNFCCHLTMHLTGWRHHSYTYLCLQTTYHRLAHAFLESQSFFVMSVSRWLFVIFRLIPLTVENWPVFVDFFNRKDAVFSYHCFHISSDSLFLSNSTDLKNSCW